MSMRDRRFRRILTLKIICYIYLFERISICKSGQNPLKLPFTTDNTWSFGSNWEYDVKYNGAVLSFYFMIRIRKNSDFVKVPGKIPKHARIQFRKDRQIWWNKWSNWRKTANFEEIPKKAEKSEDSQDSGKSSDYSKSSEFRNWFREIPALQWSSKNLQNSAAILFHQRFRGSRN